MAEYVINFEKFEIYEAGALFLTLLAFPKEGEEIHRSAHASLCARALQVQFDGDRESEWATFPQCMKPIHALRDAQEIKRDLRTFHRRLRDRAIAGKMAIAFLKKLLMGKDFKFPKGLKRLTLNQLSEYVLPESRQSNPENVETRIWRASLPVIHLAVAVEVALSRSEADGGGRLRDNDLLVRRDLLESIVRDAQFYKTQLPLIPNLKIEADSMIDIRLASD